MVRCIHCGGEVLAEPGGSIGICTRCMAENPMPREEVRGGAYEKASELLRESRFDEAIELFQELLIENPSDAAVCWGMALSVYGIEYVEDPATADLLPTLHRLSTQKFSEYLYVKKAIDLAWNSLDREFYLRQSSYIDDIQSRSLSISGQEVPVDVFICYKRTAEGEKRTADSRMAADYYRELTRRGYQVFFAEESLTVGEEYEPRIFAALQSARVMLAFASRKEYYDAVWVRNEWSRYADLIAQDMKERGSTQRLLIPVYQHMGHEDLPEALQQMDAYVEMDTSANARSELLNLVAGHFANGGTEDVSHITRQVRESGRQARGEISSEGDLEESAEKTRILATVRLVNGEYKEAEKLFRRALTQPGGKNDPENYLGLLMCAREIPGREALARYASPIEEDENFKKALACASEEQKKDLHKTAKTCRENQDWEAESRTRRDECSRKVEGVLKTLGSSAAAGNYRQLLKQSQEYNVLRMDTRESAQGKDLLLKIGLFLTLGVALPLLVEGFLHEMGVVNMVSTLAFFVLLWLIMNDLMILDTGCVTYGIRLFLMMLGYSLLITVLESRNVKLGGIVALIVTVVFWAVSFAKEGGAMKKLSGTRGWAAAQRRSLPALSEDLLAGLKTGIDQAAEPYRRYYPDFGKQQEVWYKAAEEKVAGAINELEAELEACERGRI